MSSKKLCLLTSCHKSCGSTVCCLKGDKGDPGARGPTGPTGPTGRDGQPQRMAMYYVVIQTVLDQPNGQLVNQATFQNPGIYRLIFRTNPGFSVDSLGFTSGDTFLITTTPNLISRWFLTLESFDIAHGESANNTITLDFPVNDGFFYQGYLTVIWP